MDSEQPLQSSQQEVPEVSEFARFLRRERQRRGFTQSEVAERMNVGAQTVARWERGDVPQRRHWDHLSSFFGFPDDEPLRAMLRTPAGSGTVRGLRLVAHDAEAQSQAEAPPTPARSAEERLGAILDSYERRIAEGRTLTAPELDFLRDALGVNRPSE